MKKTALILMTAILGGHIAYSQTLNVVEGNVTYQFPASEMGVANVSDGKSIEISGKIFDVASISPLYVDDSEVKVNTVAISYSGEVAKAVVSGNISKYVEIKIEGAHVAITQADDVNETTCGEIVYALSGLSDNGSFSLTGKYKSTIELRGLSLTNPAGAALDIQNGKRIELSAKNGTQNTLIDGAGGKQKGAIVCKGHLEFKGKGELNVKGNTAHAIYAKEYVSVKNCTLNVLGSVKDGINCAQYFLMESGELAIENVGDDGIQVSFKDDADREAEDTGTFTITGGKIKAGSSAAASKAIKADGDIEINGGDLILDVTGHGKWDAEKNKTKASACLGADGNLMINGGKLTLNATGAGGKGISCDGTLTINGGEIAVATSGGVYAYINNQEYINYTGNTDRVASNYKSSPKGMKADTEVVINGGIISISTTGKGAEGIESKGTLTINDGEIIVKAYDDAINSSSHMYIKGGNVTVISTNNDGLDSNGNLYIDGGYTRAFGASTPECGLDANDEEGYSVIFRGGMVIGVGGGNSTPSSSESVQPFVSGSSTVTAGQTITLLNGDEVLASFEVPEGYNLTTSGGGFRPGGNRGGGIIISCPGLTNGSSYTLKAGSASSTVTATLKGSSMRPW